MAKIRVVDVAKALGVAPETVRIGLQQGIYPFGTALKKEGRQNYTYILFDKKVEEYIKGFGNED